MTGGDAGAPAAASQRDAIIALVAGVAAFFFLGSATGTGPPAEAVARGNVGPALVLLLAVTGIVFAVRDWRDPARKEVGRSVAMSTIGFALSVFSLLALAVIWLFFWFMGMVWG